MKVLTERYDNLQRSQDFLSKKDRITYVLEALTSSKGQKMKLDEK